MCEIIAGKKRTAMWDNYIAKVLTEDLEQNYCANYLIIIIMIINASVVHFVNQKSSLDKYVGNICSV